MQESLKRTERAFGSLLPIRAYNEGSDSLDPYLISFLKCISPMYHHIGQRLVGLTSLTSCLCARIRTGTPLAEIVFPIPPFRCLVLLNSIIVESCCIYSKVRVDTRLFTSNRRRRGNSNNFGKDCNKSLLQYYMHICYLCQSIFFVVKNNKSNTIW